jgi:hypothetical protein
MYEKRNISLIYNNLGQCLRELPPQYPAPFLMQLSIIDTLFYIGGERIIDLFELYQQQHFFKRAI